MPKYFGTDGLRGKAGLFLTPNLAYQIGFFLGKKSVNKKILIGKDPRLSSDLLESSLASGIMASGSSLFLLGITTTPSIAFLLKEKKYDFGIMISASHNSYEDNGIKIFDCYGFKISESFEEEIEKFLDSSEKIVCGSFQRIGKSFSASEDINKYLDFIISKIAIPNNQLKIVLDCSNGATSILAPKLMDKLKLNYRVIANSPNGININEGCGSTNIQNLLNNTCSDEIGFSFDGDGDRIIAVINNQVFDGDQIIYLIASYLKSIKKLNKNTVVLTIMSNIGIIEALEKNDIQVITTNVGDKNVQAVMKKEGLSLGGEQSGHVILGDYLLTGDGLLVCSLFIEAITKVKGLVNLINEVEYYHQKLVSVDIKDKEKYLNDLTLQSLIEEDNQFLNKHGRILIRASGTENKVRILVESKEEELTKKILDKYLRYFEDNY